MVIGGNVWFGEVRLGKRIDFYGFDSRKIHKKPESEIQETWVGRHPKEVIPAAGKIVCFERSKPSPAISMVGLAFP